MCRDDGSIEVSLSMKIASGLKMLTEWLGDSHKLLLAQILSFHFLQSMMTTKIMVDIGGSRE